MYDYQDLIGLYGGFVGDHAILWNATAVETRAQRAHASNHNGSFQRAGNPGYHRPGSKQRSDTRYEKERRPKKHSHSPPQKAPCLPQYIMRSPVL